MNKWKKPILLAITFVIVGLMITGSMNVIAKDNQNEITNKYRVYKRNILPSNQAQAKTLENIKETDSNIGKLDSIPLFAGIEPTISSSVSDMVVGFYSFEQENVYFSGSNDIGSTWTDAIGWSFSEPPELPDVDGCGDGRFIATMVPSYYEYDGSASIKVEITDATDVDDGYYASLWTWYDVGAGYTGFIDLACGGYTADDPVENTWAYGGMSIIGDHGELGSQTPMFTYQYQEDGWAWIYNFADEPGDLNGATSTAMDIDQDNNYAYSIWNYDHGGTMDLYLFIMDFGTWGDYDGRPIHDNSWDAFINSSGNDNVLDISAYKENLIIVSERDGDIVAYYGNDVINSDVSETSVVTDAIDPRIDHTDENKATCSFIKDGVLYTSKTEDGGATWSNPVAVSEEGIVQSGDVCPLGLTYESEGTVYFSLGGVEQPIIEIQSISGGIGVSAVIKNIGNADATNVQWSINLDGLVFLGKDSSGNIASIAPDESKEIKSKFPLGFGNIDITISANSDEGASAEQTASGKLLLFFITGL